MFSFNTCTVLFFAFKYISFGVYSYVCYEISMWCYFPLNCYPVVSALFTEKAYLPWWVDLWALSYAETLIHPDLYLAFHSILLRFLSLQYQHQHSTTLLTMETYNLIMSLVRPFPAQWLLVFLPVLAGLFFNMNFSGNLSNSIKNLVDILLILH